MNICMVTIYRSENVGSVFQAYALQKILSEKNATVVFYKNVSQSHTLRRLIKRIVGAMIRLRFKALVAIPRQYYKFSKMHSIFTEISPKKLPECDMDCFVIGSDTVWDLADERPEYYWGLGPAFEGRKIISYAASAANTSSGLLARNGFGQGSLDHIQSIGVRDQYTKDIIQPLTKIPVTLVCDPTMLLEADDYDIFLYSPPKIKNYILLYTFDQLSEQAQKELKSFAKRTNRKILVFSNVPMPYADAIITREPWNFITHYKYADLVITDTFHGSVFSIIFQKQFISIQRGKNKVRDLLKRLRLLHRLVEDKEGIVSVLEQPIDWGEPREVLSEFRIQSLKYLRDALNDCR